MLSGRAQSEDSSSQSGSANRSDRSRSGTPTPWSGPARQAMQTRSGDSDDELIDNSREQVIIFASSGIILIYPPPTSEANWYDRGMLMDKNGLNHYLPWQFYEVCEPELAAAMKETPDVRAKRGARVRRMVWDVIRDPKAKPTQEVIKSAGAGTAYLTTALGMAALALCCAAKNSGAKPLDPFDESPPPQDSILNDWKMDLANYNVSIVLLRAKFSEALDNISLWLEDIDGMYYIRETARFGQPSEPSPHSG